MCLINELSPIYYLLFREMSSAPPGPKDGSETNNPDVATMDSIHKPITTKIFGQQRRKMMDNGEITKGFVDYCTESSASWRHKEFRVVE